MGRDLGVGPGPGQMEKLGVREESLRGRQWRVVKSRRWLVGWSCGKDVTCEDRSPAEI